MTEDGKECGHLLLQEPQNQGFRKRDLYRSRQGTVRQGLVEAASRMNRPPARAGLCRAAPAFFDLLGGLVPFKARSRFGGSTRHSLVLCSHVQVTDKVGDPISLLCCR